MRAILDGRTGAGPTLAEAMEVFPAEWPVQRSATMLNFQESRR